MSYKLPHVVAAFPVFCQKILPLTFDNSESYLEFVAHINAKLNEVIHALNAQNLAFNDFVNLVNECFESFKTDIENRFAEYKEEVQQALDDLEQAFNDDIAELSARVDVVENDVETLKKESGNVSIFPEITTNIDYTMEIESANCNIYYKNPNSDIWHEHSTDTTINDFIVNETAESIGNKDFLFLFCPPEGYPEEQFIFSAGAVVTATAATSEDSAAAIYSRETIPAEDFNAGLVLCADGVVTTSGEIDTVVITNSDEVQNYSCLYLSNNFALALLEPVLSFGVSVSEIFGTLYSAKTGQNVTPRIKTNGTLVYDSDGVLKVSDEIANGAVLATANRAELVDIVNNGFKNVLDLNAATNVIAGTGISYTFIDGVLTVTWENLTQGRTLKFKNIPHIDGTYILTGAQTLTDPAVFRADIRQGVDASDIIVQDYGQTNPDPFTFQSGVFDYVIRIAPESGETTTSGTATIYPMICSVPDYNISNQFETHREKINLLQLTQAEYDLIVDPDPHTLYIIVG